MDGLDSPRREAEDYVTILPPEIWNLIFEYLSCKELFRVALVCKRFNGIIHQEKKLLWKNRFWKIETQNAPCVRLCHAGLVMETNEGPCLLVLCGDIPRANQSTKNVGNILNDLWSLNLWTKVWTQLPNQDIPPLTEHGCLFYENELFIFGGITTENKRINSLYKYSFETKKCAKIIPHGEVQPNPGSCHSCFLYNNGLYVFGGWDPTMLQSPPDDKNQFYRFDLKTYVWEEIIQKGECPSRRRAHRSVIYKNYMYVFGGWTNHPENDLYRYDITTNDWCKVRGEGQTPSARSRFGMLIKGDKFYVLGGWDGETFLDDMYSFNIPTQTWTKMDCHFPRKIGQQLWCRWNNILLSFGGNDGEQAYADLYGFYIEGKEE